MSDRWPARIADAPRACVAPLRTTVTGVLYWASMTLSAPEQATRSPLDAGRWAALPEVERVARALAGAEGVAPRVAVGGLWGSALELVLAALTRHLDEMFVAVTASEPEALAREIREELGCSLAVGPLLLRHRHRYPDLEVELAFYACELPPGSDPLPLGCAALEWAEGGWLPAWDFCQADRPVLPALARE